MDSFKKRLEMLRREAGISQEALAAACGRTQGWIGIIEKGASYPRVPDIYKIANSLHVHPGALFADLPNADTPVVEATDIDTDRLAGILSTVLTATEHTGKKADPAVCARMAAHLYRDVVQPDHSLQAALSATWQAVQQTA